MSEQERMLEQLLEKLTEISRRRGELTYWAFVEQKCEAYQAFCESQLPFINSADPEFSEYVSQLCNGAMTLRREYAKVFRNGYPSEEALTNVREEDDELSGLLENICLLLKPEILEAVDAVL